jgi:hypothetical protein
MQPHSVRTFTKRADDDQLALAVLQIREGEIAAFADPEELGDGQGWIHRDTEGNLLRVEVVEPVTLGMLSQVAGDDAAAAEFMASAIPLEFILPG